ncbi:hypothetical protein ACFPIF_07955 [Brevundimonas faecalis]|uniref:hypothetical protein n=1 Tax=Brevundimonas faecalis TaxID=947378 RepID=UPI0036089D5C
MRNLGLILLLGALAASPAVAAPRNETPPVESVQPEAVLADVSAQSPFEIAKAASGLWARGDRLQAAFWFYVFQIRTSAWAEAQPDLRPLRAAINEDLGRTVNEWLASDVEAWEDMAERAIAFEARQPLWSGRPDGVTEADWKAQVEQSRAKYIADFRQVFASIDPGAIAAVRREHDLPVGPLDEPGAPLEAAWR